MHMGLNFFFKDFKQDSPKSQFKMRLKRLHCKLLHVVEKLVK